VITTAVDVGDVAEAELAQEPLDLAGEAVRSAGAKCGGG
jgi:hypothetical protein